MQLLCLFCSVPLQLTTKTQPPVKVVQYHFTSWPDHGVPEYVSPMLAFHRRINTDHKPARGPMVVHCRYCNAYVVKS